MTRSRSRFLVLFGAKPRRGIAQHQDQKTIAVDLLTRPASFPIAATGSSMAWLLVEAVIVEVGTGS
jgi:hypothetical protein